MIQLYQGDCLELMSNIPDGSIDMILCDLPYGTTQNKWDNKLPFDVLWAHYERIIKANGGLMKLASLNNKTNKERWVRCRDKEARIGIKHNKCGLIRKEKCR